MYNVNKNIIILLAHVNINYYLCSTNNNNNNSNSNMKKFFDSEACLLTIIGLGFVAASVCTFIQLLGKPHVSLIGYYTVSLVGFLGLVSLFLAGVIWHDDKKYK